MPLMMAKGVFLDDRGLQSFSVLVVLFKDLMEHSLEKPARVSGINFMGIKKNNKGVCVSPIDVQRTGQLPQVLWGKCGDRDCGQGRTAAAVIWGAKEQRSWV